MGSGLTSAVKTRSSQPQNLHPYMDTGQFFAQVPAKRVVLEQVLSLYLPALSLGLSRSFQEVHHK
jgi:hypothetical protein